jgi:carbamoyltransferase
MTRKNIIVLGINDGHDAGAALVQDGKVIAAVHEERLNNIKGFRGIPEKAIPKVFEISHTNPSDLNLIALASYHPSGGENLKALSTKSLIRLSPLLHSDSFINFYSRYVKNRRNFRKFEKIFKSLGIDPNIVETTVIEHQLAHASAAYRSSPFGYNKEDILIVTADGSGDGLSSSVNIGVANKTDSSVVLHKETVGEIKRIACSSYYDSIGNAFYTEITKYLGLKPWEHESKVMGLAPYGKPEYCIDIMRKMIKINPSQGLRFKNTIGPVWIGGSAIQSRLSKLLQNQRFDNVAAAAQQHLEDLMKKWISNAIKKTDIRKIVCAGGIFLNVKMNMILRKYLQSICSTSNDENGMIFVYPAPDDSGLPVGCALEGYYQYCKRDGKEPIHVPVEHTYYGPFYSNDKNKDILKKCNEKSNNSNSNGVKGKFKYEYYDDIDGMAGELLSKGKVLARCTGGGEWGPRALGNRSIIADPQDSNTIHKINFAIKQRDFWMPFAPSMLYERSEDYILEADFSPYMIMAFDSTERGQTLLPAAIHPYDKTCRPHTVKKEWNTGYYKIIKTFEDITGIASILNTSFNLHGYPMVDSPEVALWTLENSKLDGLLLGNYLVTKS